MKVLVRGLGNIGTTLCNLLVEHAQALGIDQVTAYTRRYKPFFTADLELLAERGVQVCRDPGVDSLLGPLLSHPDIYVFDCREPGAPLADLERYAASGVRHVSAQGSEAGFGTPFVAGVNDRAALGQARVQVASCNTHAITSLVAALHHAASGPLESADFVIARRSEDIGSHQRLISGTVVARHRDERAGTHHGADARRVFATIDPREPLARATRDLIITSSDVTTPSQLLHTVRFALRFAAPVARESVLDAIERAPQLSSTDKFDGNRVFELGRRYGFQGRLYSHAIVVANNLLVTDREVMGWAFVPQEGNTLYSTLCAFVYQTERPRARELAARLAGALMRPRW